MGNSLSISPASRNLFLGFATLMGLCLLATLISRQFLFLAVPPALLVGFQSIIDFRKIYYLLLACLPLSHELYFPNGLATDLPTEGLIVGLTGLYLVFVILNLKRFDARFLKHPIMILLLLHLGWMLVTVFNSKEFIFSLKFFTVKIWYVTVFVFLTAWVFRSEKTFRTMFWLITSTFTLAVSWAMFQHSQTNFSFSEVHFAMFPFFRNHVTYGAMMALYFPYLILAMGWYPKFKQKLPLILIAILFLLAIYFSYTRSAYVSLVIGGAYYFVVRFRLTKIAVTLGLIVAVGTTGYLVSNNNYLEYAPDYNKAISHYEFNDLLEATYQLEDVSFMERVYRWVAAGFMSKEEPLVGYGPGNFYHYYKGYTVSLFTTYVSRNPEKSGVHNYYLMTLVDQGYPGLFFYLLLALGILLYGERIYHQTKVPERKALVMTILISMFIFDLLQLINDLLETDKFGSFFFMSIAMLIRIDLLNRSEAQNEIETLKTGIQSTLPSESD